MNSSNGCATCNIDVRNAREKRSEISLWTRKEAVAKAIGQGLLMELNTLRLNGGAADQAMLVVTGQALVAIHD